MKLSIIVAMSTNHIIGNENNLPWRLSSDLMHFKKITMGKPIVMGRKTHESIGRPLPGRDNIIITRNLYYEADGCAVVHSTEEVEKLCQQHDEIMIMGGAEIYRYFLPLAERLYVTEVHAEVEGDTVFPEFDPDEWIEVRREDLKADEKNQYDYSFVVFDRKV